MTAWLFLWLWWFINTAITAAFVVSGLITFRNIHVARPYVHTNAYDVNAVLAAIFLEVVVVLLFFVISLILLLKNSINREPLTGFGYDAYINFTAKEYASRICLNGILLASSFHTALFSLVTALVIYSAKDLMHAWQNDPHYNWTAGSTAAFDASYVLAFMLAGTFLVYAVLIMVMRNVFVREEQEGKLGPNKTAATAPAPATTAAPAQQQPASGAATRKRGWFGRKNNANTPAATNEPTAPGTPAATAGAPGTATGAEAPATGTGTTATAGPEATAPKTGGAWGPNAV